MTTSEIRSNELPPLSPTAKLSRFFAEEDKEPEEVVNVPQESRISQILTEKTIKIVVLVVLYLLFLIPMASMETWDDPYTLHEHAMDMLVYLYDSE